MNCNYFTTRSAGGLRDAEDFINSVPLCLCGEQMGGDHVC